MKRTAAFALTTALLLLAGCGGGARDEADFAAWRQAAAAGTISFTAELTAVSDGEETAYTADCVWSGGGTAVTLTAPETLAGVTARAGPEGNALEFDGAILALPALLTADGMNPCAALPALLTALSEGRLLRLWREGGDLAAELEVADGETARLWLAREGLTPHYAELTEGGRTVVFCTIENWTTGET